MSGWIKISKDLSESLRFKRVVRKLRESSNALRGVTSHVTANTILLGALTRLWMHADTHIQHDDILEATTDEIDELVGVDGFAAALPADWLQVLDADHVKLPDFLAHNGGSARERKQNAKRQAAYRSRKQSRNVTQSNALRDEPRLDQTRQDQTRQRREIEARSARAPSAKRLPDEFPLTDGRRAIAKAEGVDPDREFSKFTDYWRSASGANARKHDWDAAWRNWCRKAHDMRPNGRAPPSAVPEVTWRPPPDDETADVPR